MQCLQALQATCYRKISMRAEQPCELANVHSASTGAFSWSMHGVITFSNCIVTHGYMLSQHVLCLQQPTFPTPRFPTILMYEALATLQLFFAKHLSTLRLNHTAPISLMLWHSPFRRHQHVSVCKRFLKLRDVTLAQGSDHG